MDKQSRQQMDEILILVGLRSRLLKVESCSGSKFIAFFSLTLTANS